jgi:TPR repeat protein
MEERTSPNKPTHQPFRCEPDFPSHLHGHSSAVSFFTMSASTLPVLPPLYFAASNNNFGRDDDDDDAPLPAELLHRCLTDYADWGDLARLACVQKQWSNVMYDAGRYTAEAKWELAQALLHGTAGLVPNAGMAMKLLLELANRTVNDGVPLVDDDDDDDTEKKNDDEKVESSEFHAPAMKQIALCYLSGDGVDTDAVTGLQWMKATHCRGGDVDAAHEVALIYEHGRFGVAVDVVEAVTWFRKAAEAGHMEAMAEIGLCYELGLAVEQSDSMALDWYMKAAEKGHLTAFYSVGEIFEEARGVPQSDEEACLWYYKAAIEGDEDSRRALRRLEDIARIVLPGVGKLLDE